MIFAQIPLTAFLVRFSYSTIFTAQFIQLCHMTLLLARDSLLEREFILRGLASRVASGRLCDKRHAKTCCIYTTETVIDLYG